MSRTRLLTAACLAAALAAHGSPVLAQSRVLGRCANSLPADARYVNHMSVFMGNRMWPFIILLPAGYDANAATRYPVIYLFHGRTDDECIGPERGMIDRVKTAAVTAGVGKFLYVFLNGGEQCNFNDTACPNQRAESYIMQELIPYIDANYKTIANRSGRAMDGFSMGGEAVPRYGYKYSDRFCSFVAYAGGGAPAELQANRVKILADRLKTRFVVGANETDRIASIMNHHAAVMALNIPTSYEAVPGLGHNLPGYYGYPSMRGETGGRGLKVHFDCFAEAAATLPDGGVGPGTDGGLPDGSGDTGSQGEVGRDDSGVTGTGGSSVTGSGGAGGSTMTGTGGSSVTGSGGSGGSAMTGSGGSSVTGTGGAGPAGTGGMTTSGSGGVTAGGSGGSIASGSGGAGAGMQTGTPASNSGCACTASSGDPSGGTPVTALLVAGAALLFARRTRVRPDKHL